MRSYKEAQIYIVVGRDVTLTKLKPKLQHGRRSFSCRCKRGTTERLGGRRSETRTCWRRTWRGTECVGDDRRLLPGCGSGRRARDEVDVEPAGSLALQRRTQSWERSPVPRALGARAGVVVEKDAACRCEPHGGGGETKAAPERAGNEDLRTAMDSTPVA
jgi:hypothetical protein